jgi:hypothetical protein
VRHSDVFEVRRRSIVEAVQFLSAVSCSQTDMSVGTPKLTHLPPTRVGTNEKGSYKCHVVAIATYKKGRDPVRWREIRDLERLEEYLVPVPYPGKQNEQMNQRSARRRTGKPLLHPAHKIVDSDLATDPSRPNSLPVTHAGHCSCVEPSQKRHGCAGPGLPPAFSAGRSTPLPGSSVGTRNWNHIYLSRWTALARPQLGSQRRATGEIGQTLRLFPFF